MNAGQKSNSLGALQSKVGVALEDFEKAYQQALKQRTSSADQRLGIATYQLMRALAHVLILIE
jgi:hypothetical protein